ncbi:hypothetical protein ACSBOX_17760 [Arthrobacter sp. KN11-1C]|uniref:hypothetical protein n=1 Tax=Arthrobacter sp. KN11-1C TaxID=3445774 RepID=UPI003FA11FA5
MIMFVKVLQNILFVGRFLAICVLAAVISAVGKPELELSILAVASVVVLMLAVATGIVNTRHKRPSKQRIRLRRAALPLRLRRTAQTTETFDHDPETVWAFIRPAESAVLLSDAELAFTVPGTPTGVGEQQCFIRRDGTVSIIEVIGEESPRWAATRPVTPDKTNSRSTYTLESTPTGCTLTMGIVMELPAGFKFAEDPGQWWEARARTYLKRAKEVLSARQG